MATDTLLKRCWNCIISNFYRKLMVNTGTALRRQCRLHMISKFIYYFHTRCTNKGFYRFQGKTIFSGKHAPSPTTTRSAFTSILLFCENICVEVFEQYRAQLGSVVVSGIIALLFFIKQFCFQLFNVSFFYNLYGLIV